MNKLTLIEGTKQQVLDSREVAEMVDKEHKNLMRDIGTYVAYMIGGELKIEPSEFFIQSQYKSEQNKTMPCYLVTRKGCEMIANKMTGKKGVLFTAAYIERFHEMEKNQSKQLEGLSPQLQFLIGVEIEQKRLNKEIEATNERLDGICNVVALHPIQWRTDTADIVKQIATNIGGNEYIGAVRKEAYELLETRYGVSLSKRLTNKRRRMAEEGVCKSKREKINKLDVIAEDKKLIEGYVSIVKELAIKYGVGA